MVYLSLQKYDIFHISLHGLILKRRSFMGLNEELDSYFEGSFSRPVQEALVKCVIHSYAIAWESCKKYLKEEAHDLLGFQRWIELRSQLRGLGGRFKEIETYTQPNGPAPSYHVVIDSEKIILTVSSVQSPWIMPRPASYRKEYAVQNQLDLFEKLSPNSKIFGLLIHGPNPKDRSKPAFLQVRFPDKDYESYIQHNIDLFARFEGLVKQLFGISQNKDLLRISSIFETKAGEQ